MVEDDVVVDGTQQTHHAHTHEDNIKAKYIKFDEFKLWLFSYNDLGVCARVCVCVHVHHLRLRRNTQISERRQDTNFLLDGCC